MTTEIIWLVILLLLSAFFSSSEFAYVMASKIKIELRSRKNNLAAKNAFYYINKPEVFFSTILISNNIVNIAFSSLVAYFLTNIFLFSDIQILLITTFLLLVFGELLPKYVAREFADIFILITALPLRIVTIILYPFVALTSKLSSVLIRGKKDEEAVEADIFDKEEFHTILTESTEAGNVEQDDFDIINTILEMRETRVNDVMTPRTDIVGIEISSSIEYAIETFIESGYSKLPVYEENLDNIKGIIIIYDMFKNPQTLDSIMREVIYVPETKQIIETLNELLEKQMSIAVIVDEFGGTAGIVTVEDIIEEMLGEIRDEYDVEEEVCRMIDQNKYLISGKVEIDHINEEFGLDIPEGDYATIAGYLTNALGRIPIKGETLLVDKYNVHIIRSDKTKIDLLRLWLDN